MHRMRLGFLGMPLLVVAVGHRGALASDCGSSGFNYYTFTAAHGVATTRTLSLDGAHVYWSTGSDLSMLNEATGAVQGSRTFSGVTLGRPVSALLKGGSVTAIYVAGDNGYVYCLNPDYNSLPSNWSRSLQRTGYTSDAIDAPVIVQRYAASNPVFQALNVDLVIAGTKYPSTSANRVYGLDAANGDPKWIFNPTGSYAMNVVGGLTLDYSRNLVYVGSLGSASGTTQNTVWALSTLNGSKVWSRPLGDVSTTPLLANGALYVVTNEGMLYKLDPDTGTTLWAVEVPPPCLAFASEMTFHPDIPEIVLTSSNQVTAVQDLGASGVIRWNTTINATAACSVTISGVPSLFVGGNGYTYQLNPCNGAVQNQNSTPGGGGASELAGDPAPGPSGHPTLFSVSGTYLTASCVPWASASGTSSDTNGDGVVDCPAWPQDFWTGFGPGVAHTTGAGSRCVAVGDLNADGNPDLAVANFTPNTVSVLLGDGSGGFGPKTDYATGAGPRSVAIADLNGDGKLDLAVPNATANTVSVLLGSGAGGFGAKTDFATSTAPSGVAIGDVNGDGKPDLVAANSGASTVSVLLGDGLGGFGAKTDFATGTTPNAVALQDLNGDGKLDLATANVGGTSVSVLLGDGLGGFGTKTDFPTGTQPFSVSIADLNGDGKPDLAVPNNFSNTVSVLLGDGAGGFGPKTDSPTGAQPRSVAIGDLNGDGKADLAVSNFTSTNPAVPASVSVLLGDGAGGFATKNDFTTPAAAWFVAMADVNGDGRRDLIVANNTGVVSVLLGAAGLGPKTDFPTGSHPTSVAIGDVSSDGKPDLVVTNIDANTVSVLLGDGAGGFGPKSDFATLPRPRAVALGDVNGDGKPDVVVACSGSSGVSVFLGDGAGGFAAAGGFGTGESPWSVAIGDVNADGKPDLAVANHGSGDVALLLGDGAGGFSLTSTLATAGEPTAVAIGDVNGDGKPDLVAGNGVCVFYASVFLGNGAGGFGPRADFQTGLNPWSVAIGDVSGDSKPDVVTADFGSGKAGVLLGDGTGGFPALFTERDAGPLARSIAIGDMNADGKPDLAVADDGAGAVSVLPGDGTGGFGPRSSFRAGTGPQGLALGDVNGDGRLDVAVANQASNTVSALLGLTRTKTALTVSPSAAGLGAPITMSATVTVPAPGSGTPTGTVSFFDGTTPLGTAPLGGGGVATKIWIAPHLGDHPITAVYDGDARFLSSISPVRTQHTDGSTTSVGGAAAPVFALEGVRPNPSMSGRITVAFSLPAAARARLELLDVSGRRIVAREVGSLGAGRHVVALTEERREPPGIYWLRLVQGAKRQVTRVVLLQ